MDFIRQTRSTPRARLAKPLPATRTQTRTQARSKPKPTSRKQKNNKNTKSIAPPEPCENPNNTIEVIESSQEPGPEFLIERDTCQMSPLLFDSDTDNSFDTSTPFGNTQKERADSSPMTISDSPIPNNQEGVKRTPKNKKPAVLRRRTPRSARRSLLLKKAKNASEPAIMNTPTSDSELSSLSFSTEDPLPARLPKTRNCKKKDDPSENVIENTPRTTRSSTNERIATRLKVRTGQLKMTRMDPPRPKRKTTPLKQRKTSTPMMVMPSPIPSDVTTDLSQPDRQNMLGGSESSVALDLHEPPQRELKRPTLDFDLNVRIESSQEVQIVEHKNVIISLTSSGETVDERREKDKLKDTDKTEYLRFDKSMFRRSPDLFDTFEDDKPLLELPRRKNTFFDNRRMSFFDRLGVPKTTTSYPTPISPTSKKRVTDTSIDMFGDNATFGETRRPVPAPEPIVEKEIAESRTSNANSSSVFEITRNDVFSNLLRVNSDSDMSTIQMSDDEVVQEVTPRRRPSCLVGLEIQRRTPMKTQIKENVLDSDALNSGEIAATQEQTPQKKLSLYERLCRSDPSRKFNHRKSKTGSQQGVQSPDRIRKKKIPNTGQSPDNRRKRLTKLSSDERLSKVPWTGRRLDDYFKRTTVNNNSSTNNSTSNESKSNTKEVVKDEMPTFKPKAMFTLLVLSSDDDT